MLKQVSVIIDPIDSAGVWASFVWGAAVEAPL